MMSIFHLSTVRGYLRQAPSEHVSDVKIPKPGRKSSVALASHRSHPRNAGRLDPSDHHHALFCTTKPSHPLNMFRTAILRSARALPRLTAARSAAITPVTRPSSLLRPSQFAPAASIPTFRFYSAPAGLSKSEVEGRIIDLLKNFDKVCALALAAA